jgi:signal transduction histidine kinase
VLPAEDGATARGGYRGEVLRLAPVWRRANEHPVLTDALLAATIYALAILVPLRHRMEEGPLTWRTFVFGGLMCAPLVFRRRHPRTVMVAVVAAMAMYVGFSGPRGALVLAPMIAIYTVAANLPRRDTVWLSTGAAVVLASAALLAGRWWWGAMVAGQVTQVLLAVAIGEAVRERRAHVAALEERAERAERTREEEARRRVVEERLRIARDLHDVLAHHIAVINVQAGVVAQILESEPEQARESLAHIRRAGRSALEELRATVGLLRQSDSPGRAPREPVPGLDRLPELIASFEASGLEVHPVVDGPARELPAAIDLTAYRIAQEALTNVGKHAPGVPATLHLRYGLDGLTLEVTNPAEGVTAAEPGHGMLGMRERALAVGGSFDAGPGPEGFRVRATLPVSA